MYKTSYNKIVDTANITFDKNVFAFWPIAVGAEPQPAVFRSRRSGNPDSWSVLLLLLAWGLVLTVACRSASAAARRLPRPMCQPSHARDPCTIKGKRGLPRVRCYRHRSLRARSLRSRDSRKERVMSSPRDGAHWRPKPPAQFSPLRHSEAATTQMPLGYADCRSVHIPELRHMFCWSSLCPNCPRCSQTMIRAG